MLLPGAEMNVV